MTTTDPITAALGGLFLGFVLGVLVVVYAPYLRAPRRSHHQQRNTR